MAKKVNLPVLDDVLSRKRGGGVEPEKKRPTLEAARKRLGGSSKAESPAPSGIAPGVVVGVAGKPAVVVFANADEVHVMLDARRLRRMTPADLTPHDQSVGDELEPIAADATVFAKMNEGEWVRYADDTGSARDGKLVEKCRYGALVARSDGTIVAVGFRKLWPVAGEA